jgi:alpha-glucuronidase
MTNSAGWMQNRGQYNGVGGQAAARHPKLRVERRPFLAPEVVIFGVDFTGPYILVVIGSTNAALVIGRLFLLSDLQCGQTILYCRYMALELLHIFPIGS